MRNSLKTHKKSLHDHPFSTSPSACYTRQSTLSTQPRHDKVLNDKVEKNFWNFFAVACPLEAGILALIRPICLSLLCQSEDVRQQHKTEILQIYFSRCMLSTRDISELFSLSSRLNLATVSRFLSFLFSLSRLLVVRALAILRANNTQPANHGRLRFRYIYTLKA